MITSELFQTDHSSCVNIVFTVHFALAFALHLSYACAHRYFFTNHSPTSFQRLYTV